MSSCSWARTCHQSAGGHWSVMQETPHGTPQRTPQRTPHCSIILTTGNMSCCFGLTSQCWRPSEAEPSILKFLVWRGTRLTCALQIKEAALSAMCFIHSLITQLAKVYSKSIGMMFDCHFMKTDSTRQFGVTLKNVKDSPQCGCWIFLKTFQTGCVFCW